MFQCSGKIKERVHIRLCVLSSQTLMVPAGQGLETVVSRMPTLAGDWADGCGYPEMLRRAEYKDMGWTALLTIQCGQLFWFCMPSSLPVSARKHKTSTEHRAAPPGPHWIGHSLNKLFCFCGSACQEHEWVGLEDEHESPARTKAAGSQWSPKDPGPCI